MKYLLTIILSAVITTLSQAQQYQYVPMLVHGASWQQVAHVAQSGPPHIFIRCEIWNFQLMLTDKDTIISGDTCKIVVKRQKRYSLTVPFNSGCPFPTGSFVADDTDKFYMGIREAGKKVFDHDSNLLFDFDASIGSYAAKMGPVVTIDTILVNSTLRKRFFIEWVPSLRDTIIEGIGSLTFGPDVLSNLLWQTLSCYADSTGVVYSNSNAPCGAIFPYGTPTDIEEAVVQSEVQLYPNPFHQSFTIDAGKSVRLSLYNSIGAMVLQKEVPEGISTIAADLPAGIYVAVLTDNEGQQVQRTMLQSW